MRACKSCALPNTTLLVDEIGALCVCVWLWVVFIVTGDFGFSYSEDLLVQIRGCYFIFRGVRELKVVER